MNLSLANKNLGEDLVKLAGLLAGRPVRQIEQGGHGANSRIYKVSCEDKEILALKFYRPSQAGQHGRFSSEVIALELFTQAGFLQTPRLMGTDKNANCVLMEWIEGLAIKQFDKAGMDEALNFLESLHSLRDSTSVDNISLGAEACLNRAELIRQIRLRISRFNDPASGHELRSFLANFEAVLRVIDEWSSKTYHQWGWK